MLCVKQIIFRRDGKQQVWLVLVQNMVIFAVPWKEKKMVINIVCGLICFSDSSYLEMVRNKTMR